MNAPSLGEIRSAAVRDASDEKMEQIRELLIGDVVRHLEARVAQLENHILQFEEGFDRKIGALQSRIEALAGAADGDRRATFEALAQSVTELGEQIRRISRG
jgi:hypothetical protein